MAFNFESAVSSWRKAYEHNRAFTKDDIEELERTLRDHYAHLVERGAAHEEAFSQARERIGDYASLEDEYRKVFWEKIRLNKSWKKEIIWEASMIRNYITIALRNLARSRGYAFINLSGLAVGTACVILIGLFVLDELQFDRYNQDADRIARLHVNEQQVPTPTIVAPLLKREMPNVEETTRVYPLGTYRSMVVAAEDRKFEEAGFYYADSTVFDVFTFQPVAGELSTALVRPYTIVLTESMAAKYFPDGDVIGRTLLVDNELEFEVTAVIEDLPSTSHLQFDFLGSFVSTGWASREIWNSANFYTYVKMRTVADLEGFQQQLDAAIQSKKAELGSFPDEYRLTVHPLLDLRLVFEGRERYVLMFSAVALLILLIACANYTNLATARAARRAREVGVRKVSGANRAQLARQFFGESVIMVVIALVIATAVAYAAIPTLNDVSGKAIERASLFEPQILGLLILLAVFISLIAGAYPALLLSGFSPARVLKSGFSSRRGGLGFRRVLVVFQFAVTLFLIAGMLVVARQLDFMQSRDLGFDKENVVVLSMGSGPLKDNWERFKESLLSLSVVEHVSVVHSIPGYQRSGYGLIGEGLENDSGGNAMLVNGIPVDQDVAEVLNLEMLAGEGFRKAQGYVPENGTYQYMINETLARSAGWTPDEAVGKRIELRSNREGEVVGVYGDYHYASLHEVIHPQALFIEPWQFSSIMLRVSPGNPTSTLASIREVWEREAPGRPFVFRFLDAEFDALYRTDRQTASIVTTFALLAALIACLGLIGLASFSAERRRKEIGVRKAIGASMTQIIVLMSREFALLVGIGFVVAVPAAWYFTSAWLESFAFRIDLSIWIFVAAGVITLVVAQLTVLYQSIRAARTDPATSLRIE